MRAEYGTYTDDGLVGPPFDPATWSDFLSQRRVDATHVAGTPIAGGWVNANYRLSTGGGSLFLRWYRQSGPETVALELGFVATVADRGFPTPRPVADRDGATWAVVDGWPAALFPWVAGQRPASRQHFIGEDIEVGIQLSELAARLHLISTDLRLREDDSPPTRVQRYIHRITSDKRLLGLAGMSKMIEGMIAALADYESVTGDVQIPTGPIHYDMHPGNVLVDAEGTVAAVLDFDDAHQAPLLFDLAPIICQWCRTKGSGLDPDAVRAVVAAYNSVRPLAEAEKAALSAAVLVDRAAQASGYLTGNEHHMLGGTRAVSDCGSGAELLFLTDNSAWRAALTAP